MVVKIRPGTKSDVRSLSAVLAEAFDDDPMMCWLYPDEKQRRVGLPRLFAAITRHHHLAGGGVEVAIDDAGTMTGATLWDPPGRWKQSRLSSLMMMPALARALGGRLQAGGEMDATLDQAHPSEPHWYLATIGTGTAARGRGHGKALLASRLDRCDREGIPAYLESSKVGNIPYYERFGFDVTGEIVLPRSGPTVYPMWRNPR
ncbi:MAG: GNAT family N-acetyltransferase [Rhodococcus sp. (in: high G+C Gram-positive bacteria)]|uniref:GNAT family N-acetyltransferase n=1 Tax=Rhodococcus sp. TaxID=1831 RepID=UPI003BB038FB